LKEIGVIKEPLLGYNQQITVVPLEKLKVIEVQRKPSSFHVRRLAESIKKVGFITPLVAVRRNEECLVIDGQQRLLAARELGIKELPVLIIPERYSLNLMELNVEKQMSLREKAHVALNVYRAHLEGEAAMNENDPKILDSIEFPHYVTLGMGYERNPKLFGSAYEPILKKLDEFFAVPIAEAVKKREERARLILEADEIARRAVERVKELGIVHPFVYRVVVDFCNPIRKKREVKESFEEVFGELKENLRELVQRPEKIRSQEFAEGVHQ
jgi:ParB family chromosome partitioning protein